jgi:hypothetical protein
MSTVLLLDKHKALFKDDESFLQFAQILEASIARDEMRIVLHGEQVVGALISVEEAQVRLRDRIMKRLSTNPASLARLAERLASEDIVE